MNKIDKNTKNKNGLRNDLGNIVDLYSDRWTLLNKLDMNRCSDNPWIFENGYGLDEDGNYPEGF